MRLFLTNLHAKLGEFWFYSLMVFIAMRTGDCINAFIGLWLVPKYINSSELGAVIPLTSFATFLAVPATVFATTFTKEINTLAFHREYGKMKTLMRDVFIGVAIFLVLSILIAKFTLPLFLKRIRIVEGSLGFLILTSAFIGCIAPIYTNALQALKKFKAISFIGILSAPMRLITMLIAMPFRPLSGYFAGQGSSPAFSIFISIFCLKKELTVKAEPYWSHDSICKLSKLAFCIFMYYGVMMTASMMEAIVIRQNIPDVESAASYMTSRFSEIANFLACTLYVTLFPLTAEAAEGGHSTKSYVIKSSIATILFGLAISLPFILWGKNLMTILPNGTSYAQYSWAIPWGILIIILSNIQLFHTTTEISACRFGFLKWWIPVNILYPCILLGITEFRHFQQWLPAKCVDFLSTHNINSLATALIFITAFTSIKLVFSLYDLFRQK